MQTIMQAHPDPVSRPTVNINGENLELKFRLSDLSRLNKEHGIDLFQKADVVGTAAIERVAIVLAAALAHTGKGITPEDIMEAIELPELPIYALAIVEAQKKASLASQRASKELEALTAKPKAASREVQ